MSARCHARITQTDDEPLALQCHKCVWSDDALWCEEHLTAYVCELAQCKLVAFDSETMCIIDACAHQPVQVSKLRHAVRQRAPYRYYTLVARLRAICEIVEGRILERERLMERYFDKQSKHPTLDLLQKDASALRTRAENVKAAIRHMRPFEERERALIAEQQNKTLSPKDSKRIAAFNDAIQTQPGLYVAYTRVLRMIADEDKWVVFSQRLSDECALITVVFRYGDVFVCGSIQTTVADGQDIMHNMTCSASNVFMFMFANSYMTVSRSLDGLLLMAFPLTIDADAKWFSGECRSQVLWMVKGSPVMLPDAERVVDLPSASLSLRNGLWAAAKRGMLDTKAVDFAPILYLLGPYEQFGDDMRRDVQTTLVAPPNIHPYSHICAHWWFTDAALLYTDSAPVIATPCAWSGNVAAMHVNYE